MTKHTHSMRIPCLAVLLTAVFQLQGCVVFTFDGESLERVPAGEAIAALEPEKFIPPVRRK
jgi:hypothetical protein